MADLNPDDMSASLYGKLVTQRHKITEEERRTERENAEAKVQKEKSSGSERKNGGTKHETPQEFHLASPRVEHDVPCYLDDLDKVSNGNRGRMNSPPPPQGRTDLIDLAAAVHFGFGIWGVINSRQNLASLLRAFWQAPFACVAVPSALSAGAKGLQVQSWDIDVAGRAWAFWYTSFGVTLMLLGRARRSTFEAAGLVTLGLCGTLCVPKHVPFWLVFLQGVFDLRR